MLRLKEPAVAVRERFNLKVPVCHLSRLQHTLFAFRAVADAVEGMVLNKAETKLSREGVERRFERELSGK